MKADGVGLGRLGSGFRWRFRWIWRGLMEREWKSEGFKYNWIF